MAIFLLVLHWYGSLVDSEVLYLYCSTKFISKPNKPTHVTVFSVIVHDVRLINFDGSLWLNLVPYIIIGSMIIFFEAILYLSWKSNLLMNLILIK